MPPLRERITAVPVSSKAGRALCLVSPGIALLFSSFSAFRGQAQTQPQNQDPPRLHQRTEPTYGDVRSRRNPQVPSTLPSEASGEYLLGKPGDVIEIILDGNGLTGYISMIGKNEKEKDAALTYFFDDTELSAKTLTFTTRPVHGKWYSFDGTIVRGVALTKAKEGYYQLLGTLTLHNSADRSEQPRHVALPLARSIDG